MSEQREKPVAERMGPFGRRHHGPGMGISAEVQRAEDIPGVLRRILRYLGHYRRTLVAVTLVVFLTSGLGLLTPYLTGLAIDDGIIPGNMSYLLRIVLLMIGAYVLGDFGHWLQAVLMIRVAQGSLRDIRRDLFDRLQTLSLRFFARRPHGELMSRLTNDTETISATLGEFDLAIAAPRAAGTAAGIYGGMMGPSMGLIRNLTFALIAGVGGWMVLQDWITIGLVAAFINYARNFSRPLNEIAMLYASVQSAIAGAERVFAIMDETPEIVDASDAVPLTDVRGHVVFEDVNFGYDSDEPVLRDVSFEAEPGQTIALVGPTGAGKTTIINLLTRFYDIDSGRITVDGHDIRQLRTDDLRSALGIVLQDTFLFAGSVRDNIRYGRLDATDQEIEEAARLANAHTFITRLPEGYETALSEAGGQLSEGQRQLLAIARAILADPAILILDEATSSVDSRTEAHIQEAMRRIMEGRTSFVIAHRLSTIRRADLILVIEHGRIVERGTHDELLDARGAYHTLYTTQSGGEVAA